MEATFVFQGQKDHTKQSLVITTSVSRLQSTKIVLGIAAIFEFQLSSSSATQADVGMLEELIRDEYLVFQKKMHLKPDCSNQFQVFTGTSRK